MRLSFQCAVGLRCLVAGLLLGACGASAAPPFPEPGHADDVFVDIGFREEAARLGYGWSRPERKGAQRYRWIKKLEADLWFEGVGARAHDLWLRAAPFYLHYRRQNIGVYINDRFVTEWVCPDDAGYADYYTRVPVAFFREGRNRVTFRMGYTGRIGKDKRALSLAVDKLLLRAVPD